jgi:sialidase-1
MPTMPIPPQVEFRRDIGLSVVLLVFALLFVVIYVVFLTSFAGEFLIVIKGMWILPVFVLLFLGNAIASLVLAIRSLRTGVFSDLPHQEAWPAHSKKAWLIGWSVWNLAAAIPIVLVGKVLALGALGSVPTVLIALLALPFVGTAAIFFLGSVATLFDLVRRREGTRLPRGLAGAGLAFLFAFGAFAVIAALWAPRWMEGVVHTPLFTPGEERGRSYRIPAMVVLPGDVLLAFAESRVNAMSDLLDIDLVMKRSLDGGRTWGPLVMLEDQDNHTVHSPCPLYDAQTRTVWLPFCVDYQTLYLTSSADAGVTWSEPRNVSRELGLPADTWCHNGPGNGIQMTSGRLVIPTSVNESSVLFSDDHGLTWWVGAPIGRGEEPQVFERADGALCANLRNARGSSRIVACSPDGGQTWEAPILDDELPDAGTQASILRHSTQASGGVNRLLFSNPGAPYRGELMLRLSYDEGETWPVSRLVYEGAAGYSQLAVLSDGSILVLFEAGRYDLRESITLARVSLDWLTESTED